MLHKIFHGGKKAKKIRREGGRRKRKEKSTHTSDPCFLYKYLPTIFQLPTRVPFPDADSFSSATWRPSLFGDRALSQSTAGPGWPARLFPSLLCPGPKRPSLLFINRPWPTRLSTLRFGFSRSHRTLPPNPDGSLFFLSSFY